MHYSRWLPHLARTRGVFGFKTLCVVAAPPPERLESGCASCAGFGNSTSAWQVLRPSAGLNVLAIGTIGFAERRRRPCACFQECSPFAQPLLGSCSPNSSENHRARSFREGPVSRRRPSLGAESIHGRADGTVGEALWKSAGVCIPLLRPDCHPPTNQTLRSSPIRKAGFPEVSEGNWPSASRGSPPSGDQVLRRRGRRLPWSQVLNGPCVAGELATNTTRYGQERRITARAGCWRP